MRVLFFGTVDLGPGYPRSRALLQALEGLGAEVELLFEPLGGGHLHRSARSPGAALATAGRLLAARRRLVRRARRTAPPDLVVVGYPAHLAAGLARRLWPRVPRVLDLFLSVQDTLVHDRARCRPGSLGDRLAGWLDRRTVDRGDLVLLDTEEHCDRLAELTGRDRAVFAALPCGDPDAPVDGPRAYAPPRPGEPLRLLFVGTGIPLHGRPYILEAVREVQGVELTVVGGEPLPPAAAACPRIRHLSTWVDRAELSALHRQAHLALGIFGATPKADRVLPLKVYNALAEGLPVLTGDSAAARRLLVPDREVLLAPRGEPAALAARLRRLVGDPAPLGPLAAAGAAAFTTRFAAPALARTLAGHLERLGFAPTGLPAPSPAPPRPAPEEVPCA